jgi:glycosyltransferase involved in cell wall biosynthesis
MKIKDEDKIIGLLRIRNEAHIIQDTLDRMQDFCKHVYIYDDASEDNTVEICKNHPVTAEIICETKWNNNQEYIQSQERKALLEYAKFREPTASHFIYMDADEVPFIDDKFLKEAKRHDMTVMKLYNAVMTKDDKEPVEKLENARKYFDPVPREIPFIFHRSAMYHGGIKCERYPKIPTMEGFFPKVLHKGLVQHYGRAISKEEWDKTCDHYIKNVPALSEKWKGEKKKGCIRKDIENLKTWDEIKKSIN